MRTKLLLGVGVLALGLTACQPFHTPPNPSPHAAPPAAIQAMRQELRADIRLGPKRSTTALTWNWGGYAVTSGNIEAPDFTTFSAASGSWRIPRVVCPTATTRGVGAEDTIVADWVGLDGFNTQTVEQLGSSSQCFDGHAYYYTWYEMYPSATVSPNGQSFPVAQLASPGDVITASITTNPNTSMYHLSLTDAQHPAVSFTAHKACSECQDASAEWVVERPSYGVGVVPEADFGHTTFTDIAYTAQGANRLYQMQTIDATGTYYLQESGPLVNHSFTSTWKGSY